MKKAKFILTGLAILTVVGGALAFKAKSAFSSSFCTSSVSGTCPNLVINKQPTTSGTAVYYAVKPTSGCSTSVNCYGNNSDHSITTSTTFLASDN